MLPGWSPYLHSAVPSWKGKLGTKSSKKEETLLLRKREVRQGEINAKKKSAQGSAQPGIGGVIEYKDEDKEQRGVYRLPGGMGVPAKRRLGTCVEGITVPQGPKPCRSGRKH